MGLGLRVFNSAGVKTFDSQEATGGVCLGFFTVPTGGGSKSFPAFPRAAGYALSAGRSGGYSGCTLDNSQGYLRFTFEEFSQGHVMVLFAK